MSVKKETVGSTSTCRTYKSELDYLYARRLAVDALIESLVEYDRCRAKRLAPQRRKTA